MFPSSAVAGLHCACAEAATGPADAVWRGLVLGGDGGCGHRDVPPTPLGVCPPRLAANCLCGYDDNSISSRTCAFVSLYGVCVCVKPSFSRNQKITPQPSPHNFAPQIK